MKIHFGLPKSSNYIPRMMLLPSHISHAGRLDKKVQMLVRVFRACFPDSYQLVPSLLFPITWTKTLGKIQIMTFWQQKSKGIQTLPRQIWNKPSMEVPLFPARNSPWCASMNSSQLRNKDHTPPTCNINYVGMDQLPSQESVCTWNKLEELYKVSRD